MARLITIRGYPGSGKTTVGKLLEAAGHGTFIDHNAILTYIARIVGNDTGIYDDIHRLELALTHKLLSEGNSAIVARGFSSMESILPYIDMAEAYSGQVIVIRLEATYEILASRVSTPERLQDFNPTTDQKSLKRWMEHNPIEDFKKEHIIDASQEITSVMADIEGLL